MFVSTAGLDHAEHSRPQAISGALGRHAISGALGRHAIRFGYRPAPRMIGRDDVLVLDEGREWRRPQSTGVGHSPKFHVSCGMEGDDDH
jgi:hypothetical protein